MCCRTSDRPASDLAAAVTELHNAKRLLLDLPERGLPAWRKCRGGNHRRAKPVRRGAQKVLDLSNQLHLLNKSAGDAGKALKSVNFPLIEQRAKDAVDPIAQINHHFDDLAAKAKNAGTYTQAFADDLESSARRRSTRRRRTSGSARASAASRSDSLKRPASRAPLASRSPAHSAAPRGRRHCSTIPRSTGPATRSLGPGTSAHEGINGRWALDIAFAPGPDAAEAAQGVRRRGRQPSVVKKEAGHFHIEGQPQRSGGAGARGAAAPSRSAARTGVPE
jgi:hypothetical protein